jgi:hypothetical protein
VEGVFTRTYDDLRAVTPSDTAKDPAGPFMGLVVTVAGTLKLTTRAGTTLELAAVVVGQEIKTMVQRVWSTGTSATVAGYVGPVMT